MDSKHWLCEDCMKVGIITPATEAHHVIRLTPENINDSTVALNWNNLVAVCKPCHDARHNEAMDKHRFKVDENGKILM